MYDTVKNKKNRRTLVKRKENSDERMNQVGNYHDYHSLLPKRNTVLPPNIDFPPPPPRIARKVDTLLRFQKNEFT